VLVVARERGFVERVSPLLNRLAENGIYVSQRLRDWVRD
jgi:predicted nucleic acid-binding protein